MFLCGRKIMICLFRIEKLHFLSPAADDNHEATVSGWGLRFAENKKTATCMTDQMGPARYKHCVEKE